MTSVADALNAQGESRRQLGASVKGEWAGATSAKFTTKRQYIAPGQPDDKPHPLFDMGGRHHFEEKSGYQPDWKPSVKPCLTKDDARPDPARGLKKIPQNNNKEPTKLRPEKKHSEAGR